MSTSSLTQSPPPAAGQHTAGPRPPSWLPLTVQYVVLLCRHPAVIAGVVLAVAPWVLQLLTRPQADDFADLTSSSHTVQYPALTIAAGTYLAAHLLAGRARRHHTDEAEAVLSLPRWHRGAALCAATTAPALLALVLALARVAVLSAQPGAVGTVQPGHLLTVPALILLAGALGVALGAVVPSAAVAFVAVAGWGVVTMVGLVSHSPLRWLAPVAGEDTVVNPPLPSHLVQQPQWWHLAWLLTLTALAVLVGLICVAAATTTQGGRGYRELRRRRLLPVAAGVVTLLAFTCAAVQLRSPTAAASAQLAAARTAPAAQPGLQTCQVREQVTYCAFEEFTAQIDAWEQVVQAQLSVTGDALSSSRSAGDAADDAAGGTAGEVALGSANESVLGAAGPLVVRQHIPLRTDGNGFPQQLPVQQWNADEAASGTGAGAAIPVSTRWSAGGLDSYAEQDVFDFSATLAARLVTAQPLGTGNQMLCGARGALSLWLAAQAIAGTRRALATIQAHTSGLGFDSSVMGSATTLQWGTQEVQVAEAMLA